MTQPTDAIGKLSAVSGELMEWLKTTAQNSEAFVLEQAPLYVQEYVAWVFWSNAIYAAFWAAIVLLCVAYLVSAVWWAPRMWRRLGGSGHEPVVIIPAAVGLMAVCASFGGMFVEIIPSAQEAIKAKVAPRVVIVEHVSEVLR